MGADRYGVVRYGNERQERCGEVRMGADWCGVVANGRNGTVRCGAVW